MESGSELEWVREREREKGREIAGERNRESGREHSKKQMILLNEKEMIIHVNV